MDNGLDWERLARYVRTARGPRSQKAIHALGGPTDTTISKIEANEWRPTRGVDQTLEKLENGLGWQPGDAARILAGDEPRAKDVIAQPAARIVLLSEIPTDDLFDELRRRIPDQEETSRPTRQVVARSNEPENRGWGSTYVAADDPRVGGDENGDQRHKLSGS